MILSEYQQLEIHHHHVLYLINDDLGLAIIPIISQVFPFVILLDVFILQFSSRHACNRDFFRGQTRNTMISWQLNAIVNCVANEHKLDGKSGQNLFYYVY